jgi:hypothetical protein
MDGREAMGISSITCRAGEASRLGGVGGVQCQRWLM